MRTSSPSSWAWISSRSSGCAQTRITPPASSSKAVAVAQPHRLRQIDQHLGARYRCQHDTAAKAAVVVDQHLIDLSRRIPGAGRQDRARTAHQNRKYRCAIGRTVAGSQVSSTPSARTS